MRFSASPPWTHNAAAAPLVRPGYIAKDEIGGDRVFAERDGEKMRQALAAVGGVARQPDPAAFDIGLVGFLEALRRRDLAVGVARAALPVAGTVERLQHLLGELAAFAQHRFDDVDRRLGEARQIAVAVEIENVREQKQRVVDRSFVAGHFDVRGIMEKAKPRRPLRVPSRNIVYI